MANCNVYMVKERLCTPHNLCTSCAHHKKMRQKTYLVVILLTIGGGLFCGGVSGPSLYYIACHCSIYGCAVREEDTCVMIY